MIVQDDDEILELRQVAQRGGGRLHVIVGGGVDGVQVSLRTKRGAVEPAAVMGPSCVRPQVAAV